MSLAVTKEWILKLREKLLFLQEEKTQLFLRLSEVLREEEKWRWKEQSNQPDIRCIPAWLFT